MRSDSDVKHEVSKEYALLLVNLKLTTRNTNNAARRGQVSIPRAK